MAKKDKNPSLAKVQGKKKIGKTSTQEVDKTYKDLKREAVIRGMPFPDVVEADVYKLIVFNDRSNNKPDISLVDKYDEWIDKQLEQAGYGPGEAIRSSRLRLGFIGEEKEDGTITTKRIKGIPKPKKKKRERDDSGLYKGTKKSYTYELASKGFSLERVQKRVLKKFPDAKIKSIKIWFSACMRNEKG